MSRARTLSIVGVVLGVIALMLANGRDLSRWMIYEECYLSEDWFDLVPLPASGRSLYGFGSRSRWDSDALVEGPFFLWYAETGTLAICSVEPGSDGVVSFFDIDGKVGCQMSAGGELYFHPPWLEVVDPAGLPPAPWIELDITASEWWESVRPE